MLPALKTMFFSVHPTRDLLDIGKKLMKSNQWSFRGTYVSGLYLDVCQSFKRKLNGFGLKAVSEQYFEIALASQRFPAFGRYWSRLRSCGQKYPSIWRSSKCTQHSGNRKWARHLFADNIRRHLFRRVTQSPISQQCLKLITFLPIITWSGNYFCGKLAFWTRSIVPISAVRFMDIFECTQKKLVVKDYLIHGFNSIQQLDGLKLCWKNIKSWDWIIRDYELKNFTSRGTFDFWK